VVVLFEEKRMSAKKKEEQKHTAEELISSFGDSIICYCDGACKKNPGPGGSGCFIEFLPKGEGKEKKLDKDIRKYKFIGKNTKSGQCELLAFEMVLDNLLLLPLETRGKRVLILSDSKYCVNMMTKNWEAKENVQDVDRIREKFGRVKKIYKSILLDWVPSHCGIRGNEIADELANLVISLQLAS
jgi:ribonuclease HI